MINSMSLVGYISIKRSYEIEACVTEGQAMTAPSKPFDFKGRDALLRDPKHASTYLAACLEDGDLELFQQALRNVAKAQEGGMRAVAELADLNRESLYKSLSKEGKPQLATIAKMLSALGLRLTVSPAH